MSGHAKMKDSLEGFVGEVIYPSQFFSNDIFGIANNREVVERYFDETDSLSENPSYKLDLNLLFGNIENSL